MKRYAKVYNIINKSQGNYPGSTVIDMGKYWESTRKITVKVLEMYWESNRKYQENNAKVLGKY